MRYFKLAVVASALLLFFAPSARATDFPDEIVFNCPSLSLPDEGLTEVERYFLRSLREFVAGARSGAGVSELSQYRGFDAGARFEVLSSNSQGRCEGKSNRLNFDFEYEPSNSVSPSGVVVYIGGLIVRLHFEPSVSGTFEYQPGFGTTNAAYFDFHENGMLRTFLYWRNIYPHDVDALERFNENAYGAATRDYLSAINRRLAQLNASGAFATRSATPYPSTEIVKKFARWDANGALQYAFDYPDPDQTTFVVARDGKDLAELAPPFVKAERSIFPPPDAEREFADVFANFGELQLPEKGLSEYERNKLSHISRFLTLVARSHDLTYSLKNLSRIPFDDLFDAHLIWRGARRGLRVGVKFRRLSEKEVCAFEYETDFGRIAANRSIDKTVVEVLFDGDRDGMTLVLDGDFRLRELYRHHRATDYAESLLLSKENPPQGFTSEEVDAVNEVALKIARDPQFAGVKHGFSDLKGGETDVVRRVVWNAEGTLESEENWDAPYSGAFPSAGF